jgi:hypothetical protein
MTNFLELQLSFLANPLGAGPREECSDAPQRSVFRWI